MQRSERSFGSGSMFSDTSFSLPKRDTIKDNGGRKARLFKSTILTKVARANRKTNNESLLRPSALDLAQKFTSYLQKGIDSPSFE